MSNFGDNYNCNYEYSKEEINLVVGTIFHWASTTYVISGTFVHVGKQCVSVNTVDNKYYNGFFFLDRLPYIEKIHLLREKRLFKLLT